MVVQKHIIATSISKNNLLDEHFNMNNENNMNFYIWKDCGPYAVVFIQKILKISRSKFFLFYLRHALFKFCFCLFD